MKFILCVYDAALAFGGPEEGGWWYEVGSLVQTKTYNRKPTKREVDLFYKKIEKMNRAEDRTDITSVNSRGSYVGRVHEGSTGKWNAPEFYPTRRPYYS